MAGEGMVFSRKRRVLNPPSCRIKKKRGQGQHVTIATEGLRPEDTPQDKSQ
jgi:hypothetical protein